jgi:DNA primase
MSKNSISSTKYLIVGEFETKGIIDKPDLIGAFFGQTEGLIGENLEFQNLQKTGKLGRIEINLKEKNGNSYGKFEIPTSLDKNQVALVAAAIESIKKIGHCEGSIKIKNVIDVREEKRKIIFKRAKEILENIKKELPDSEYLTQKLNKETINSRIKKYEKEIYGGNNVLYNDEIILVEGRADVINLIKNGFDNVICFNGSNIPKFISNLTKTKITTAFLDGDRGGEKELEELLIKADIDYYTFAPEGKEVENLSFKEILKCLKNKISVEEKKINKIKSKKDFNIVEKIKSTLNKINNNEKLFFTKNEFDKIKKNIDLTKDNNKYYLLDKNLNLIKSDEINLISKINDKNKNKILIFNGICENSVINTAKKNNINLVICKSKAKIKNYENINVKLFDDFIEN